MTSLRLELADMSTGAMILMCVILGLAFSFIATLLWLSIVDRHRWNRIRWWKKKSGHESRPG